MDEMCTKHSYDRSMVSNGWGVFILFKVLWRKTLFVHVLQDRQRLLMGLDDGRFKRFVFHRFIQFGFSWHRSPSPPRLALKWHGEEKQIIKSLNEELLTRSTMPAISPISHRIDKNNHKTFFINTYREFCIHVSEHEADKIDSVKS